MKAANAAAFHPSGPQPTCLSALLITLASRARAGQEAECNTPVLSELWNPVAGRPPLSERLHLIVLLPIPPPLPPDSVGDRHHGLVNQPIQCGGTGDGKHPLPCIFRFSDNFVSFGANPPPKHESKWRALTMLNMFTEHSFPKTRGVLLWDQLV